MRTIAILAVMLVHAGTPGFQAGWIGVDLFFALSGFLITTLLLQENERLGRISYADFLVRRGLRLMPAYFLYAAILTVGLWAWPGSVLSEHGGWTPGGYTAALWTYTINFAPMGGLWNGQEIAVHLWSLAVEQQYYLVWPLVVIAFARRPQRLLAAGALLTGATLLAFLLMPDGDPWKASMLFTRGFTLALASTLAVACHQRRTGAAGWRWGWAAWPGGAVVLLAFALSAAHVWPEERVRAVLLPFMSLAFALWVAWLWYRPLSPRLAPLLLNPVVQYIGKVSYGVYLYHELVRVAVWHVGKPLMAGWPSSLGYVVRLLLYAALSVAVAALSYELVEKRFLALRSLFRRRSAAPAGAASTTETAAVR